MQGADGAQQNAADDGSIVLALESTRARNLVALLACRRVVEAADAKPDPDDDEQHILRAARRFERRVSMQGAALRPAADARNGRARRDWIQLAMERVMLSGVALALHTRAMIRKSAATRMMSRYTKTQITPKIVAYTHVRTLALATLVG